MLLVVVVVVVGHGGRCSFRSMKVVRERKAYDFCYCEKILEEMEELDSHSMGGTRWLMEMIRIVRCVISDEK